MCERKGRGVTIDERPVPSRLMVTAICVSLVFRSTRACRSGMAGTVPPPAPRGYGFLRGARLLYAAPVCATTMRVKAPALLPALLLLAACGLAACSSSAIVQQGPSDTLRAYAGALEQGRVDDAYRLLSDEAKRSMSLEAFRRAVTENPQDVLEIARAIARPSSDPVVTATVTVPSGDELVLVYEAGRWKIDAAAVDLYGQATPRQALLGFLRAFDRKRYDVILRYVPDAEIEGISGVAEEPAAPPPEPQP